MKKAIVVVDMQKDFIDGALGTKEAQAMLPRMEAKLAAARAAGTALVFTMDTHGEDYLATQEGKRLPVPHCIRGTKGWEIAASLQPFVKEAAAVVEKPTFGSTELPAVLADRACWPLHRYMRHFQCPAAQGLLSRKAHIGRRLLLCRRDG